MKPIAVLQHSADVPPGYLATAMDLAGVPYLVTELFADEPLPDLNEVAAVVSLGGVMGAYDEDEYPFLVDEKVYLRRAVELDVPVLGICLGCQLLADALGGSAFKAERLELEFLGLELTAAGESDAVVSTLAAPVISFHEDTWSAPPGAAVLAVSSGYPGVFRYGSALAIQSHPEASAEIVARWIAGHGPDRLVAAGVDPYEFLAAVDAGAAGNEERAAELFALWLEEAMQGPAAPLG